MPAKPDRTVVLAMIVKDEAHVIARSLESVRWMLSSWVICDTGSTDDTERVARGALAGIPGEYHHRPWVDFSHNRNESLALARPKADYTLILDADDLLWAAPGAELPPLRADAYELPVDQSGLIHYRQHLVANRRPWRFEGVLHERLRLDEDYARARLPGFIYRWTGDGARHRDPDHLARDIALLARETQREPDEPRHWYLLAQTLAGASRWPEAIVAWRRRIALGADGEEAFIARLQLAGALSKRDGPPGEVSAAFLAAHAYRPARAEPLFYLAAWHRQRHEHAQAWVYATAGLAIPRPPDGLLIEPAVYEWKCLYEKAAAAFRLGWYDQCIADNERLLRIRGDVPGQAERLRTNIALAKKARDKR